LAANKESVNLMIEQIPRKFVVELRVAGIEGKMDDEKQS
jgi:hypothetical protein